VTTSSLLEIVCCVSCHIFFLAFEVKDKLNSTPRHIRQICVCRAGANRPFCRRETLIHYSTDHATNMPSAPLEDACRESASTSKSRPVNFSRPRPASAAVAKQKLQHDRSDGTTTARGINACHEPNRLRPHESGFSSDSRQTNSGTSAGSELAWDGDLGEPSSSLSSSPQRPAEYDRKQRYPLPPRRRGAGGDVVGKCSDRPILPGPIGPPRMSAPRGEWEGAAGDHTDSVAGGRAGTWSSSDYDVSGLSAAEINKLRKKGINPALYVEMQAARKGKWKWVSPIVGNTFL